MDITGDTNSADIKLIFKISLNLFSKTETHIQSNL